MEDFRIRRASHSTDTTISPSNSLAALSPSESTFFHNPVPSRLGFTNPFLDSTLQSSLQPSALISSTFDGDDSDLDVNILPPATPALHPMLGTPYRLPSSQPTRPGSAVGRDGIESFNVSYPHSLGSGTPADYNISQMGDTIQMAPATIRQIQNANRDTLIRLRNSAYIQLSEQHEAVLHKYELLRQQMRQELVKVAHWEAEVQCCREECEYLRKQNMACLSLINSAKAPPIASASMPAGSAPPSFAILPPSTGTPQPTTFTEWATPPARWSTTRYWEKDDWTKTENGRVAAPRRSATGVWTYLEGEDGTPIASSRYSSMLKHQYSVFHQLKADKITPPKWSEAHEQAVMYHRISMCSAFPELAQGSAFWKVRTLATEYYPNYHAEHVATTKRVRQSTTAPTARYEKRARTVAPAAALSMDIDTNIPDDSDIPRSPSSQRSVTLLPLGLDLPSTAALDANQAGPSSDGQVQHSSAAAPARAVSSAHTTTVPEPVSAVSGVSSALTSGVHASQLQVANGSRVESTVPLFRTPTPEQSEEARSLSLTSAVATAVAADSAPPPAQVFPSPSTDPGNVPSSTQQATEAPDSSTLVKTVPALAPATPAPIPKRVNPLAKAVIRAPQAAANKPPSSAGAEAKTGAPTGATTSVTKVAKVEIINNAAAKQKKAGTKVALLRAHATSISARNLCIIDYINTHPNASKEEFETHFSGLDYVARKAYEDRSKEAAKARKIAGRASKMADADGEEDG